MSNNKPSWLDDEEVQSRAANVAVKVASNSSVQKAVINAAVEESGPAWAKSSYKPPVSPTNGVNPTADPEIARQSSVVDLDEQPTKFECPPEELKGMNTMRYVLAFFYLASAINLAVSSGLSLVGATNVGLICFALYIIFFSAILCCYELAFGDIARVMSLNFGFLYTFLGRGFFVVFVAIMSFSISLYGQIAMALLLFSYCVHVYVRCKYPRFEEYMRKKHYFKESPTS